MFVKFGDKICDISGGVLTLINKGKKETADSASCTDDKSRVLALIKDGNTERIRTYTSEADGRAAIEAIANAIANGDKIFVLE